MVVVELREEIVEFRRVLGFECAHHSRLEKLAEGLGLFHCGQQPQAPADLVLVHALLLPMDRLQNNEEAGEIASLFNPAMGGHQANPERMTSLRSINPTAAPPAVDQRA